MYWCIGAHISRALGCRGRGVHLVATRDGI